MATNTVWQLDPAHSEVQFRVRHLMVSTVSGKFNQFSSTLTKNGATDFSDAQIEFSIDTHSIDTGVEFRDNHLRSEDFFAAEKFPTLRFKGNGMKAINDHQYQLDGLLTIRDVTKPVSFQVEFGGIAKDPYGNIKAGFEVSGKIKRKEFGLLWDGLTEAGGAVVGDEVKIQANVQYTKTAA